MALKLLSAVFLVMVAVFLQTLQFDIRQDRGPCGKLPTAGKYASLLSNSTAATAFYQCIPNYGPAAGNTSIHCLNGVWDGQPLTCKDVYNCEDKHKPCKNGGLCQEYDPNFSCICNSGEYRGTQTFFGGLCEQANGMWSNWQSWDNCTSTCDGGIMIRRRLCDNPAPTAKGKMCRGPSFEKVECTREACPYGMYEWCDSEYVRCGNDTETETSFCSIRDGSYKCTCLGGVEEQLDKNGNFITCIDIDECKDGKNICDNENSVCTNTHGSYRCVCKTGFIAHRYQKYVCNDVDECEEGISECDENARCLNTQGSYNCKCKPGYQTIAINQTGYVGECIETRLLPYGLEAGDAEVTNGSEATGEMVTKLIEVPSGIPLLKYDGEEENKCKSLYASENGVIIITDLPAGADTDRKATFRNSLHIFHPSKNDDNAERLRRHLKNEHICALLAPMWADADMMEDSKMWYQTHDMEKQQEQQNKPILDLVESIRDLYNTTMRYVTKITWQNMVPPWPSVDQKMTFQSLVMTNGIHTFFLNSYQHVTMAWRPVFSVPVDFPMYNAFNGIHIQMKNGDEFSWWNRASGKWSEPPSSGGSSSSSSDEEQPTVYRLHNVKFESTQKRGRDMHNLTEVTNKASPVSQCNDWYFEQTSIPTESTFLVSTCPQRRYLLVKYPHSRIVWSSPTKKKQGIVCYDWKFRDDLDGSFECCYDTREVGGPLVEGLNAYKMGSGFYYRNKTEDEKMREICCTETKSNYFCSLFSRKRPPTSSRLYKPTLSTSGSSGIQFQDVANRNFTLTAGTDLELLKAFKENQAYFTLIGRIQDSNIVALQLTYNMTMIEIYLHKNESEFARPVAYVNRNQLTSTLNNTRMVARMNESDVEIVTKDGYYLWTGVNPAGDGLVYKSSVFGKALHKEHDLSGVLTPTRSCLYYDSWEYQEKLKNVACDLLNSDVPVEDRGIGEVFPTNLHPSNENYKQPVVINEIEEEIHRNNGNTEGVSEESIQGKATHSKTKIQSGPGKSKDERKPKLSKEKLTITTTVVERPHHFGKVLAVAKKRPDGNGYKVSINSSKFDGDIKVVQSHQEELGKGIQEEESTKHNLHIEVPDLEGLENMKLKEVGRDGSTASVLHPSVIICDCDEKNGECITEQITPLTTGPFAVSAACKCRDGYEGKTCSQKVSPCSENPCFSNVACLEKADESTGKPYTCENCPDNFDGGNGETCFHDNPCLKTFGNDGAHKCVNAECKHLVGSYDCECYEGFSKISNDEHTCTDIDECVTIEEEIGVCDETVERCINTPGSYNCICLDGYENIEEEGCVDIDECLVNKAGCERRCENTVGSFRCVCEVGYRLNDDMRTCTEYDECDEYAKSVCPQICIDSEPGKPFKCGCYKNYYLDENYRDCIFNNSIVTVPVTTPIPTTVKSTLEATTTIATTTITTTTTPATTQPGVTTKRPQTTLDPRMLSTRKTNPLIMTTTTSTTTENKILTTSTSTTLPKTTVRTTVTPQTTTTSTIQPTTTTTTTTELITTTTEEVTTTVMTTTTTPVIDNDYIMKTLLSPAERLLAKKIMQMLEKLFRFTDANLLAFYGKLFALSPDASCLEIFETLFQDLDDCEENPIFESGLLQLSSYFSGRQGSQMMNLDVQLPDKATEAMNLEKNATFSLGRIGKLVEKVESCQSEVERLCEEERQRKIKLKRDTQPDESSTQHVDGKRQPPQRFFLGTILATCFSSLGFFIFLVTSTRAVCSWKNKRSTQRKAKMKKHLGAQWPRVVEYYEP